MLSLTNAYLKDTHAEQPGNAEQSKIIGLLGRELRVDFWSQAALNFFRAFRVESVHHLVELRFGYFIHVPSG